jgi:hypothetical protein
MTDSNGVNPMLLEVGDAVRCRTGRARWVCRKRILGICKCGLHVSGWAMSLRYEVQIWWDDNCVWNNCDRCK